MSTRGTMPAAPAVTPAKHRLLLVDDEGAILLVVSEYFRRRGYEVVCARGGEEAKALLAQGDFACVIADLRLTNGHAEEGLAIAAFARERCPAARIVILTAYDSAIAEKQAESRKIDALILKPTSLADMARVVSDLLEGS